MRTATSPEPRLTIDGVKYEDSEEYYQEHKPAAEDWSEEANEQRVEVMCTVLDAKFAASGEARALLVTSHPHRLLSIKRDRFWGFDAELKSPRSWLIFFRALRCRSEGSINYTARTILRLYVRLENKTEWRTTNLF